jgi:hypothetical protein
LAQDYSFSDDPVKPKTTDKGQVLNQPKRTFKHQVSKAAATEPQQQTTVLNSEQLKQCGYAYINNGIVRGVVDRSVFFIQGERTKAVVDANDEQLEVSTDEEAKKLQDEIGNDTLIIEGQELADGTTTPNQPARIKKLKRKLIRLNKRVKLYQGLEKGLNSALVFGRGFLEIVRIQSIDYPTYGEPVALKHLTTKNVSQVFFNRITGVFEGIDYNTGATINPTKFIKAENLIPFFHDDNNILENTQGSGLSAVWPILSVSQSDDVINDEDIPEITKNTGGVLTVIRADTNDDNKLREIKEKANGKTQMVVGAGMVQDVLSVPLGRDPHELTDVRTANGKYICQCMNLPLFLMYEDTANFATANQTMQVYKAGVLKRYRTWLQGILEDYWYDTILADHLGMEVKHVLSAPIKVTAIFADINFETRAEVINADKVLVDMAVMNEKEVAKDIDRPDIVKRLQDEEADKQVQQQQEVQNAFQTLRAQNLQLQNQNQNQQQNQFQQLQQKQQASAAASVKEAEKERDESEINDKRLQVLGSMQKVLDNLD